MTAARLTPTGVERYANAGAYNQQLTGRLLEAAKHLRELGNAQDAASGVAMQGASASPSVAGRSAEFLRAIDDAKPMRPEVERAAETFRAQWLAEQGRANKLGDECGRLATELKDERARCRELERKIERIEGKRQPWKA